MGTKYSKEFKEDALRLAGSEKVMAVSEKLPSPNGSYMTGAGIKDWLLLGLPKG